MRFRHFTKPHLYRRHGVWVCRNSYAMGHGYTPDEAYADWNEQIWAPCWGLTGEKG